MGSPGLGTLCDGVIGHLTAVFSDSKVLSCAMPTWWACQWRISGLSSSAYCFSFTHTAFHPPASLQLHPPRALRLIRGSTQSLVISFVQSLFLKELCYQSEKLVKNQILPNDS